MSVFIGWSEEDIRSELGECYQCVCSTDSSIEDKFSAVGIIGFAAIGEGLSEELQFTAQTLLEECNTRIRYGETGVFSHDPQPEEKVDLNACPSCGENEGYSSECGGLGIACNNCGHDFDRPWICWWN
ncbi:hypothetical protein [Vibrio phage RYC]|nr:hypothetical protein [Vibrio phage RYC]